MRRLGTLSRSPDAAGGRARHAVVGALVILSAGPIGALGQRIEWYDSFDLYPLGPICGLGGWEERNPPEHCAKVTDERRYSGPNSLKLFGAEGPDPGDDALHPFKIRAGIWNMSIMTYVPRDAEGVCWVLMLNRYPNEKNWSLQVLFDADLDVVANVGKGGGQSPLIRGRWVDFRVHIDLEADTADYWYDFRRFESASWTDEVSGGGDSAIRALHL